MNYLVLAVAAVLATVSVLAMGQSPSSTPATSPSAIMQSFITQQIRFEPFVFAGENFPKCDYADPAAVRQLVGPYTIKTTFYDAAGQEVATAKTPGRYAAVVQIKYAARTTKRFITLYRTATGEATIAASRPAYFSDFDPQLVKAHASEIGRVPADKWNGTPQEEAWQAVVAAGLSDLKALKAAGKQLPADSLRNLDRQWWVTFKRHYYGYDKTYAKPFVCPVEVDGPPATVVQEGTLAQAGFKETAPQAIDQAAEAWVKDVSRGFHLVVVRHGVIAVNKAYGTLGEGPRKDDKYTTDTIAPLASCTKLLSGILMSEFNDQGLIDFDQPLAKYLPTFGPDAPKAPTIRQAYVHIAGLSGHWGDLFNDFEERLADLYPTLEVGKKHEYEGVSLAAGGHIMEMMSGVSVPRLYQKCLFEPLGCKVESDYTSYGGMATATDLARIAQMMLNGGRYGKYRFTSQAAIDRMMPIPGQDRYQPDMSIRWGIGIKQFDIDGLSEKAYSHPGASGSFVAVDPTRDLVIAMTRFDEGGSFKDFLKKKGAFIKVILEQFQDAK